jgi:hypothetical protein
MIEAFECPCLEGEGPDEGESVGKGEGLQPRVILPLTQAALDDDDGATGGQRHAPGLPVVRNLP